MNPDPDTKEGVAAGTELAAIARGTLEEFIQDPDSDPGAVADARKALFHLNEAISLLQNLPPED